MSPCTVCKHELRPGARFCDRCGERQSHPCPQCGDEARPITGTRHGCGCKRPGTGRRDFSQSTRSPEKKSPSGQHNAAAQGCLELRPITVLFADLKGYTALSENCPPERVLRLMRRIFTITDHHVVKNGGRVDKHIGDAVMAVFGQEAAHEDDAIRAIRAALGFQADFTELAINLVNEGFPHLRMRVGVNSGFAAIGAVDGRGDEVTVTGDVINVASRLEGACPAGGILISSSTRALAKGRFETQSLGLLQVKGKADPLKSFLVLRERQGGGSESEGEQFLGRRIDFVGRKEELNTLWSCLADRHRHHGAQLVTLIGQAGMGKTRLLQELNRRFSHWSEDPVIFRVAGIEEAANHAFHLLQRLLESQTDGTGLDRWVRCHLTPADSQEKDSEVEDLISSLARLFRHEQSDPVRTESPKDIFSSALHALTCLFERLSERSSIVLLVDDAHWSDAISLFALEELLVRLRGRPIIALVAGRAELGQTHSNFGNRLSNVHRMRLTALSREATQILCRSLLRTVDGLPDSVIATLAHRCDGVPYYLKELAESLVDSGAIVRADSRLCYDPSNFNAKTVPVTLESLLQTRLDRLNRRARQVAQMCAVAGRTFWDSQIGSELGPGNRASFNKAIQLLCQHKLIVREKKSRVFGAKQYRFTHDLMRAVAYRGLDEDTRRHQHEQVARWLESQLEEGEQVPLSVLGHHWERAGSRRQAQSYYLAAAQRAVVLDAISDAEKLYAAHLRLVGEESEESIGVRELRAWACWRLERLTEAYSLVERALVVAREARARHEEGMALANLAWLHIEKAELRIARDLLGQAILHLEESGPLGRARATRQRLQQTLGVNPVDDPPAPSTHPFRFDPESDDYYVCPPRYLWWNRYELPRFVSTEDRSLMNVPGIEVYIDAAEAERMGAFQEDALSWEEAEESGLHLGIHRAHEENLEEPEWPQ